MSGDVQPRKRKDKKKKRDDESSHGVHITKMGSEDVHFHVQHEHGTGGHWCAKIFFFSLLAILFGLVGLIILEHRGISDLDTPLSESRFSNYFDGWVDESRQEHDDHDPVQASIEEHDEHDEPFEEEEDHSELDEDADEKHDEEDDDDDEHDVEEEDATTEQTKEEEEDEDNDEKDEDNDNDDEDDEEDTTAEATVEQSNEEEDNEDDNDVDNDNTNNEDDDDDEDENVTQEVTKEEEENDEADDNDEENKDEKTAEFSQEANDDDDNDNDNEVDENNSNADAADNDDDDDADNDDDDNSVEPIYERSTQQTSQRSTGNSAAAVDDDDDAFDEEDDDDDDVTNDSVENVVDNDAEELLLLQQKARQQAAEAAKNAPNSAEKDDKDDSAEAVPSWASSPVPEVCIDQLGCIEGVHATDSGGQQYEAFYGIPFAKPPIGELRFKNPLPVDPWKGKLMTKEPRTECIQYNQIPSIPTISGKEDCLYLNLYRPKKSSTEKLPVLFYIHGGGLFSGTSSPAVNGPEYFMETNEVILVLPAYRLGQFGFLSTGDEHMTGNFGLKDQNMALKWVQKYIYAFNGDPSRVTIFGHSAGSISTHLHMLSPASRGLFRNAVLMSGQANSPFIRKIDQKSQVIQLAKGVGITNANEMSSSELADALRNVQATDLLKAGADLKVWSVYPFATFRTTIEQESWSEPFLTEDTFKLIGSPKMPKTVPWIGGYTSSIGEGTVMALRLSTDPDLQADFNKNFYYLFKLVIELNGTEYPERVDEVVERLVVEYMDGVRELNKDTIDGFLELLGDCFFTYPLYKTIASNVNSGGQANSLKGIIKFGYRGPYTFTKIFTGSLRNLGAVHVDDFLYLYRMSFLVPNGYGRSTPEAELVKKYVALHVEYAKTGNVEAFNKVSPCSKDKFDRPDLPAICDYLSIVNDTELFQVGNKWDVKRMKLWKYVDKTLFDI